MCQRGYVEIWITKEVWRARKRRSLISALQTSQVLNISTHTQLTAELKHELIVL